MDNIKDKYEYIGDFNQGVAIVVKNNLYGVILMGGNEIIAPSYDYISPFKDGYAQAIRKGECKILDLSGRECKQYEGKLIAIPTKYDSVRDFKNGYACVQLNGKWGAIDVNCNEIYEPQFYFLSDFVGGTAKYKTEYKQYANSWGFLNVDGFRSECNLLEPEIEPDGNLIIERYNQRVRINNKGQLLVKNGESMIALPREFLKAGNFENGLAIVQDSTGYWGAVDINGRIVIALQYTDINSFRENKAFAKNKNGKLCLISANGTIIKEFATYSDGYSFKGGYAIVVTECGKHGLINNNGKEILSPLDGYIHYTKNPHEFEITSFFGGKHGLFMASTGLLIKPRYNKIIEVKKDCVKVEVDKIGESLIDLSGSVFVEKDGKRITFPDWCIGVKYLNENLLLGVTDNGRWGLLDGYGETICKPTFDNIGEVDNNIIPLIKKEIITLGDGEKKRKK
ncbi:WG repeat-containing protein [Bacteroides caecigallinarum]|uniref:WG repeat-containing protein n=1 Tax=Bacteroides caecigallinarum TaxID=1411144 RepID=UPI001959D9DF|nr:WG repeat-containing protein [Bacteroides caecigallinarum]MBM6890831.1 WG repeat-containing protein [Bacteroides caecigallinarum]